jgi:hypothetical protein
MEPFDDDMHNKVTEQKKERKRSNKILEPTSLYICFPIEQIMEFFDWGFLFPTGYFDNFLTENDINARFQKIERRFHLQFFKNLHEVKDQYYLEIDVQGLNILNKNETGCIYCLTPMPVHYTRRIYCSSITDQDILKRLWALTDNDPIETIVANFEASSIQYEEIEVDESTKLAIVEVIRHLDRCFGAICFTKDLDPFIKYNFKHNPSNTAFSGFTISRNFLSLINEWMPNKSKKLLTPILGHTKESERRYVEFVDRLVSKNWNDDKKNGYLMRALTEGSTVDEIISLALRDHEDQGEISLTDKINRTLKGLVFGTINIKEVLQDNELKRPNILFLILLKLYYRKGKIETDSQSFRNYLFEKDVVSNPMYIDFIGVLYGYYIGYHNLRKNESLSDLDGFNIKEDEIVYDLFRQKLSTIDKFEKIAFNLIYNRIVKDNNNMPQLPIEFKTQSKRPIEFIREVETTDKEKKTFKFLQNPVIGRHGYEVILTPGPNIQIQKFLNVLKSLEGKKNVKVACFFLIIEFLHQNSVGPDMFQDVSLSYKKREVKLDMEIDQQRVIEALEKQLEAASDKNVFLTSIKRLVDLLEQVMSPKF